MYPEFLQVAEAAEEAQRMADLVQDYQSSMLC